MNKIFNLVKKELEKVFKSPRAIVTNFILPGLLILIIYMVMGNIMLASQEDTKQATIKVAMVNQSVVFDSAYNAVKDNFNIVITPIKDIDVEDINAVINFNSKEEHTEKEIAAFNRINSSIENLEYDVWLLFSPDFDEKYALKQFATVGLFSKRTNDVSSYGSQIINSILQSLQPTIINTVSTDFSSKDDISTTILATTVPMLLLVMVFTGGMGVCADSIAGEKERGTISTLLMAPIKRSHIIYGKIISLIILTILSAIGPFVAVVVSIPQLLKASGLTLDIGLNVLTGEGIFQIFLIVLVIAMFATSLLLLISTLSRSVKEANMISSPILLVIVVLATITTTMNLGENIGLFFIPIVNLILGLNRAIMGILTVGETCAIIGSTILYCIILTILSILAFKSEKVLYS